MSQLDLGAGNSFNSFNTASAVSVTATLRAPGVNAANRIKWIAASATGATVAEIQVTENDGSTMVARIGGVGTTCLSCFTFEPIGIVGKVNDAAKVILITTGGTLTNLAVGYDSVPM